MHRIWLQDAGTAIALQGCPASNIATVQGCRQQVASATQIHSCFTDGASHRSCQLLAKQLSC